MPEIAIRYDEVGIFLPKAGWFVVILVSQWFVLSLIALFGDISPKIQSKTLNTDQTDEDVDKAWLEVNIFVSQDQDRGNIS